MGEQTSAAAGSPGWLAEDDMSGRLVPAKEQREAKPRKRYNRGSEMYAVETTAEEQSKQRTIKEAGNTKEKKVGDGKQEKGDAGM